MHDVRIYLDLDPYLELRQLLFRGLKGVDSSQKVAHLRERSTRSSQEADREVCLL